MIGLGFVICGNKTLQEKWDLTLTPILGQVEQADIDLLTCKNIDSKD